MRTTINFKNKCVHVISTLPPPIHEDKSMFLWKNIKPKDLAFVAETVRKNIQKKDKIFLKSSDKKAITETHFEQTKKAT